MMPFPVLSKALNPGLPNGPPKVDGWVVHITFGYMLWSEITIKP